MVLSVRLRKLNGILMFMIYVVIGIASVTLIGFIAHRIGLCLVKAVGQALDRNPSLLVAILMSGVWVGAYSVLASINHWPQPQMRFAFTPLFAIGGFIFGVGASINQGCSVSTMHQLARGNLSMLFTLLGWFLGWCAWISLTMQGWAKADYQMLAPLDPTIIAVLFWLSVAFTLLMILRYPQERSRWVGISVIGLLVGVLFYIEPMWAPSKLIQDTGSALLEGGPPPSLFRNILVLMLLVGMWISVLIWRDHRLEWPTPHKTVRHSIAGVMMGFGGAMALGGNDSQILMGLPSLSIGAIVAVVFMMVGIAAEQILFKKGKLFYQKR